MAYPKIEPCASFDQMILDLQKIYANWIAKGRQPCVDGNGNSINPSSIGAFDRLTDGKYGITIEKCYARKQAFFISCSSIDQERLKTFCEENKLKYRIHKYNSQTETLYISGPSWAFAQSELNGLIAQSRKRAKDLQDLAQKFYESEMMREVWKAHDKIFEKRVVYHDRRMISFSGVAYRDVTDWEGYTDYGPTVYKFRDHRYRNLENENELIAFALAFHARDWKTDPKGISWEHLEWYINIENPCSDGSMVLYNMPRYTGTYLHEQPKVTEVPLSPPLKDFF